MQSSARSPPLTCGPNQSARAARLDRSYSVHVYRRRFITILRRKLILSSLPESVDPSGRLQTEMVYLPVDGSPIRDINLVHVE